MDLIGFILVVLALLAFVHLIAIGTGLAVVLLIIGLVLLWGGYGWSGGRYGVSRRRW